MFEPRETHFQTERDETEETEENPFNFKPRVFHLQQEHDLFEDGDVQRHMYLQNLHIAGSEEESALSVSSFSCHIAGCSALFQTLTEYEHHYNSLHRHVCCTCRRSLPSARLLDLHLQEWHDSLFAVLALKQDMFQCLVEGCGQKFRTIKTRKDHLINLHKYPPDFRFNKEKKEKREKRPPLADSEMEAVADVCESEGVCEVLCGAMSRGTSRNIHAAEGTSEENTEMLTETSEVMETSEPQRPRFSHRVPSSVCFGHGSVRGFRGRRGKRT